MCKLPRSALRLVPLICAVVVAAACHPGEPYVQPAPGLASRTLQLKVVHFSDYHAHAVPYFSEHQHGQAGIARALAYVKKLKQADPNLLVLNGGDMWNSGTPAWSDKYHDDCTEWTWWNGLVTAMAFGNHDVDYGWPAFERCQKQVAYPVLSSNLVDAAGSPILKSADKPYLVRQVGGLRIGMFALSGPDFSQLVKATNLPTGAKFEDGIATAQRIVQVLREQEKVDAVILFGHQHRETDFAMAQKVPGIDLILGTHSHYKGEMMLIPGTQTAFISPFQYLNYLSEVTLSFVDGKLQPISGKLVRLSSDLGEDATIAVEVQRKQKALEADPTYAPRFAVIGQAAVELDFTDIDRKDSVLGNFVMDTVRTAAPAHAGFSTASSFRASIPPGPIRMEDYLTALPYRNKILALTVTGAEVMAIIEKSNEKRASDNFAVISGVRYVTAGGKVQRVRIAKDPMSRTSDYEDLVLGNTYTVMTTDFMANIAADYKGIFAKATATRDTGLIFNDVVINYITTKSPISAAVDGRVDGN